LKPITSSSFVIAIPLTPAVFLPVGRTFSEENLIAFPCFVASINSFEPSTVFTLISASSDEILIDMIPPFLGLAYVSFQNENYSEAIYLLKLVIQHPTTEKATLAKAQDLKQELISKLPTETIRLINSEMTRISSSCSWNLQENIIAKIIIANDVTFLTANQVQPYLFGPRL